MKIFLYSKLIIMTFYSIVFNLVFVGSILASTAGSGQSIEELELNMNERTCTLKEFFDLTEQQSSYRYFYIEGEFNTRDEITISSSSESYKEMLQEIANQEMLHFKVVNDIVVVKKVKNTTPKVTIQEKKEKTITGKVLDEDGKPLPGVSVVVHGTSFGVITNVNGEYTLKVPEEADALVFSFLGMKTQLISITDRTDVNVKMAEETFGLDEIVAVGYGTQKKINLTGAVDQVTNETFENRSVSNTTQALQGVVPNLNITIEDGKPTRTSSYNVRGTGSIGQGGNALVLIDGVEGDPSLLNPNDIESVSVLKDAASAAIYGARGSFGVVLITTRKPEKGQIKVNYTGNFSLQKPVATQDNVTDGYTWAERFREAYYAWNNYSKLPSGINKTQDYSDAWLAEFKERKEAGITDEVVVEDDGSYTYYGNTDYYKELYKDYTFTQDHNLMISGGNKKSDFYISSRFYDYNGLFRYNTDDYQTVNLRAKGSLQVADWLRVSNNVEYSDMTYHNPINVGEGGGIWRNIADEGHPCSVIKNPDESLTFSAAYTVGDFIYGKNSIDTHKKVLKNITGFNASFFDNKLRVNGDFSFRNYDNNYTRKRVPVPYSTSEGETSWLSEKYNDYKVATRNTFYTATNLYAEFEDTFADNHYFKAMAGYNYETSKYESSYVQRNGLLLEDAESLNLALGESIETSAGYEKWRILGLFFRLNYSFKDRYLLEVNGRYDGSSKFPENEQYAFFPSVSAGWRISEEPFWEVDKDIISNVKLRASYGSLGNGNIDSYSFQELYSISTSGRVLNGALNKYTSAPNPLPDGLTWETATTADFGLDFSLINNKLQFSGDYYVRKTSDMYTVGETLPDVYGADSPYGNYADMTTKGWEISLSWRNKFLLNNSPFNYEVRATLSDYSSVIDKYNNSTNSLDDYYEGMKIGEIWGYKADGLLTEDDLDTYVNTIIKSSTNYTVYAGDIKFVDNNDNGKIDDGDETLDDSGDMVVIGNTEPRYIYSFKLSADWKGFFFSSFFQGVGKQDWYPGKESGFWGQYNRPYNNLPKWHLGNYWTEDNSDAYLPRYCGYNKSVRQTENDRYLQSVAYIRLKNIQLGYSLPRKLISKVHIQNARIYISGENIWDWSPLYRRTHDFDVTNTQGSDPDLTSGTSGDNYSYPLMKSYSLGLSLTF